MLVKIEPLALRDDRTSLVDRSPVPLIPHFSLELPVLERLLEGVVRRVIDERSAIPDKKNCSPSTSIIPVATKKGYEFILPENILSLRAEGPYTYLNRMSMKPLLISKNIGALEKQLCPNCFLRIGRSWIVNLREIKGIELDVKELLISDNSRIRIPGNRLQEIRQALNI